MRLNINVESTSNIRIFDGYYTQFIRFTPSRNAVKHKRRIYVFSTYILLRLYALSLVEIRLYVKVESTSNIRIFDGYSTVYTLHPQLIMAAPKPRIYGFSNALFGIIAAVFRRNIHICVFWFVDHLPAQTMKDFRNRTHIL